jgi:hypothetical protein
VVDGRLVPNATEQAALARPKALREERQSLRKIADALASEFNLKKLDATSVKRTRPDSRAPAPLVRSILLFPEFNRLRDALGM